MTADPTTARTPAAHPPAAESAEPFDELSTMEVGDLTVLYLTDPDTGQVGLRMLPTALMHQRAQRRRTLADESWVRDREHAGPAIGLDPLVHLKIIGDPYAAGFSQGRTLRGSATNARFGVVGQDRHDDTVITTLTSAEGLRLEHRLTPDPHQQAVEVVTTFTNDSVEPVRLELLTSFTLGGISPFAEADAPERLVLHRFRSSWSAEGRLVSDLMEQVQLERSWSGTAWNSERFGQVGTMPVRGWFPTVVVEDVEAGVCWGARIGWAGSWQLEASRTGDDVCLSGGLADRELGHWTCTVGSGESITTPPAYLTCVQGGVDAACERLVSVDVAPADAKPEVEQDLPLIFNEWCTTWGDPQHDQVLAIADKVAPLGVRYLVIDAGWYRPDDPAVSWFSSQGDWQPSSTLFPYGIEATAKAIRERGLVPGLWFEMETVGRDATAFGLNDHLLRRDGLPITAGVRRFWDLTDPWVVDYLSERVIGLLDRAGFGYLKVDYNETVGLGVDHPDGLGEGLRRQVLASHAFFERVTERLPDLVIENCSSGGHRLEASMLHRTSMSSFSDAHETVEIPVVAAALHRLMLPRQSQIWAVLHAQDSPDRLVYSLAAGFLGRLCLSGDVLDLSADQWWVVEQACALYRRAAPAIKSGRSVIHDHTGPSWRHPRGWQAVVRHDHDSALVVLHTFADAPDHVEVDLPPGHWAEVGTLPAAPSSATATGSLAVSGLRPWQGRVYLFSAT